MVEGDQHKPDRGIGHPNNCNGVLQLWGKEVVARCWAVTRGETSLATFFYSRLLGGTVASA